MLERMLKQYRFRWVGGFKDMLMHTVFYVSMINFCLIAVTAYNTVIGDYILNWIPGFRLWMFFAVLILLVLVAMILEYKFVIPSLYSFRSKQMFEHESKVMDELKNISQLLEEISKKEKKAK